MDANNEIDAAEATPLATTGGAAGASPYDARPWLANYPDGMPHDCPPLPASSVGAMFEQCFDRYADRAAFSCLGKSMDFAAVGRHSTAMGAYLQSLGLVKGDRVAVMMPNVLQYPVAICGILRAGLTVVNVNPLYTARELRAPAQGFGREGHRGAGELRGHLREGARPTCRPSTWCWPRWATCSASRA